MVPVLAEVKSETAPDSMEEPAEPRIDLPRWVLVETEAVILVVEDWVRLFSLAVRTPVTIESPSWALAGAEVEAAAAKAGSTPG